MNIVPITRKAAILPAALLLLFTLAFGLRGTAGDRYVLYLKNGTLITCQDYDHIPGHDFKVRLSRKNYILVPESDVFNTGVIHRHAMDGYELDYRYDTLSRTYIQLPDHYIHEHGFFLQWQTDLGLIDGMRLTMGYRFNTYVALGVSMGGEYGVTLSEPTGNYAPTNPNVAPSYVYNSGYSPFLLYIMGDVLKTQITPFYSVEIGYNLPWYPHLETDSDDGAVTGPYSYYNNFGGLTAGVGFGCRFYTRKRCNISISVNMNAGYMSIQTQGFQGFTGANQNTPVYVTTTSKYVMTQPSLRFSIGF